MILHQFYLNCLAHASYLVGDERSQIAAVVDPQRDIDQYLAFAREHDLRIAHVLLTHLHADFIAGHLELRDRVGATIYLGAAAKAEYAFTPLADGDSIEFGAVRLQALETPGHTPESISILVFDRNRSGTDPYAVLTGDTLFVGDVGRPDLRVALGWSAADLGGMLYESLTKKLLRLPDASLVYPAHGAGSLCGKAISKETVSTIGEQRQVNYALQPMTKGAFVELVTADQPDAPPYFTYDAVLNSKERPTLDETLARELNPMTLDQVLALQDVGGQLLDTRDPAEFAAAHLQAASRLQTEESSADHCGANTLTRQLDQLTGIIERAEHEHAGLVGSLDWRNQSARPGGEHQPVITDLVASGYPDHTLLGVDLFHANAQASPDSMFLVPLDIVQNDIVEFFFSSEHARQQNPVVVDMGLLTNNGDLKRAAVLQQLLDQSHAGHAIPRDHQMFNARGTHAASA